MKRNNLHEVISMIFLFLNILVFFVPLKGSSQDLDCEKTIDYINNKFKENPYFSVGIGDITSKYSYFFTLTNEGELVIKELDYSSYKDNLTNNFNHISSIKSTYTININDIDINETFGVDEDKFFPEPNQINIYPLINRSYMLLEETSSYTRNETIKKTISGIRGDQSRQYIEIYIGDAKFKQNIKNALSHLCELVLSNPKKYKVNAETDPFEEKKSINTDLFVGISSNKIKITKNNGVYEIPVILNDVLKINFIIDSGASEVSVSPDVALTLIKTGTITNNDFLPSQTYRFADGSTAESNRFIIRTISIGNQVLKNTEASISNSIEAPMLIGQNVLEKFGSITIDYKNQLLIIKAK